MPFYFWTEIIPIVKKGCANFCKIRIISGNFAYTPSPALNATIEKSNNRLSKESITSDDAFATVVRKFAKFADESSFTKLVLYWPRIVTIIFSVLVLIGICFSISYLLLPYIIWYAFFFSCLAIFVVYVCVLLPMSGQFQTKDVVLVMGFFFVGSVFYILVYGYIFMCVIRCCQLIALEEKLKREDKMFAMNQQGGGPLLTAKA